MAMIDPSSASLYAHSDLRGVDFAAESTNLAKAMFANLPLHMR